MKEFAGKTAIVTGAAQGIGESTAMLLAKKGATVAIVDKNVQGAEEVVARIEGVGSKGVAIQADVTKFLLLPPPISHMPRGSWPT